MSADLGPFGTEKKVGAPAGLGNNTVTFRLAVQKVWKVLGSGRLRGSLVWQGVGSSSHLKATFTIKRWWPASATDVEQILCFSPKASFLETGEMLRGPGGGSRPIFFSIQYIDRWWKRWSLMGLRLGTSRSQGRNPHLLSKMSALGVGPASH